MPTGFQQYGYTPSPTGAGTYDSSYQQSSGSSSGDSGVNYGDSFFSKYTSFGNSSTGSNSSGNGKSSSGNNSSIWESLFSNLGGILSGGAQIIGATKAQPDNSGIVYQLDQLRYQQQHDAALASGNTALTKYLPMGLFGLLILIVFVTLFKS